MGHAAIASGPGLVGPVAGPAFAPAPIAPAVRAIGPIAPAVPAFAPALPYAGPLAGVPALVAHPNGAVTPADEPAVVAARADHLRAKAAIYGAGPAIAPIAAPIAAPALPYAAPALAPVAPII